MVKVLVLGATGFVGQPIAATFARAGHHVFGLARSEAKAKALAAEEIIPILGDATKPEAWVDIVKDLDVIIDAVGGSTDIKAQSKITHDAVSAAAKSLRPPTASLLTYIYCSGTWVHGDNRKDVVKDTTPITNPVELVSWRPDQEQRVVKDTNLNGIVIRPALLYGKNGSLLHTLFEGASKGAVSWPGTPGGRLATIHADDLAQLFVLVSERALTLRGLIFDAANDATESTDDFLAQLVVVSGAQGPYQYTKPANLFEVAMGTTTLLRPFLGRALVGWSPRKQSLIDGLETYYAAWKASQA